MTRVAIRSWTGGQDVPPRFCDLLIKNGEAVLEKKNGDFYVQIRWDELKSQVEKAVRLSEQ